MFGICADRGLELRPVKALDNAPNLRQAPFANVPLIGWVHKQIRRLYVLKNRHSSGRDTRNQPSDTDWYYHSHVALHFTPSLDERRLRSQPTSGPRGTKIMLSAGITSTCCGPKTNVVRVSRRTIWTRGARRRGILRATAVKVYFRNRTGIAESDLPAATFVVVNRNGSLMPSLPRALLKPTAARYCPATVRGFFPFWPNLLSSCFASMVAVSP